MLGAVGVRRYNAKATFFNVANQTAVNITGRVLEEGHTLGAHTHHHTALPQTRREAREDTLAAEARIAKVSLEALFPFPQRSLATVAAQEGP